MSSLSLAKKKSWVTILGISPFVLFWLFFLFHFLVLSPMTKPMQGKLENEFQSIPIPSQAELVDYRTVHKTDQVNISAHYETQLSSSEIFSFYDQELPKQGWQFVEQRDITLNAVGRDYCKDDYVLSANYYGIGYEWKQELWLSWGRPTSCPIVKGGMYQWVSVINNSFLLVASLSWSILAVIIGYGSWGKSSSGFHQFATEWGVFPNLWRMRIASLVIFAISALGVLVSGNGILELLI